MKSCPDTKLSFPQPVKPLQEGTCREGWGTFLLVISLVVKAVVVFAEEEENRAMATEYIGLPGELVEKVKEAAAREEITPEELVRDAVENRLSRAEWRKTVEFGHRNARERGLKPEDVDAEISGARAELSL
jgi:hypothetical protein